MHNLEDLLNIIKTHEGFRSKSYLDVAGFETIGYGFKRGADPELTEEFFIKNSITEKESVMVLEKICIKMWSCIEKKIKVDINFNQRNALVSLVFNIGTHAFITSTLLQRLNNLDFEGASNEYLKWSKVTKNGVKIHNEGLYKRRILEKKLFAKEV